MAATLEGTIANLETSQTQNKRFVADVSHELRTPLTALVAEASLLEARLQDLPPDARRPAELLVTDVGRLRVLVEDLMELSRFDAHAEQILLTEIDLVRLVRATIAARLPAATLQAHDPELIVQTDPRRLDRILGNLLDNAREHAPGAAVDVSLGRDGPGGCSSRWRTADRVSRRPPAGAVRTLRQGRCVAARRQRPRAGHRRRARRAPRRIAQRARTTGRRARVHAPSPCH